MKTLEGARQFKNEAGAEGNAGEDKQTERENAHAGQQKEGVGK